MSITIEGLTKQQRQIADLLWSCDTQEAVHQLIQSLPPEYKQDAVAIHQLMIAAVFDQYEDITEDVEDLISRISGS